MDIGAIERNLSPQRFSTYLRHAGNDVEAALALYQRNTSLGESLHGAIQGLEVCLRNAFHRHLTTAFGTPTWYDVRRRIAPNQEYTLLVPRDVESIREVRERLIESKGSLYPGDPGLAATPAAMVAALSFGFWVSLSSSQYELTLWRRPVFLQNAFGHVGRKPTRDECYQRLNGLRMLRNRVAHHEPIFARNLKADLALIIETIGWICPQMARWVTDTNTLAAKLA